MFWCKKKEGSFLKKVGNTSKSVPNAASAKKSGQKEGLPFFFSKDKKRESLQKRWEIKTLAPSHTHTLHVIHVTLLSVDTKG